MTYLLDTDVVIDHLTGRPRIRQLLVQWLPRGVAISIITYSEIFEGIYGSRDPRAAEAGFTAFLQGVQVLGLSEAIAKQNAQLRLDLRQRKLPIRNRALDLLIAATALTQNLTLVTRNEQDYDDIPNLSRYEWGEEQS